MRSVSRAENMNLKNITKFLIKILPEKPKSAVILGSGLGNFVDFLENSCRIPEHYSSIPERLGLSVDSKKSV